MTHIHAKLENDILELMQEKAVLNTEINRLKQKYESADGIDIKSIIQSLEDCVDSIEYVERNNPGLSGWGVRAERIATARNVLNNYQKVVAMFPPLLCACTTRSGRNAVRENGVTVKWICIDCGREIVD